MTMKAIDCSRSGPPDVLRLIEVDKPVPKANEVLVKVRASTVTAGDVIFRKMPFLLQLILQVFGLPRKKIPGHELAGEIEAVGEAVSRFKPGDQVFGTTTGLVYGANAEYVCVPEEWKMGVLALKPANASYEESAALPVGGMTAIYLLREADIQPGQKVLVYGASGSVGAYAVQLAKHFGAEVTGVCSSANEELVKSLGADKVIDYGHQEWAQMGENYDVVFDAVRKLSSSQIKGLLKETGIQLSVKSPTAEQNETLLFLKQLVEEGKLTAVIDRRYPLEQTAEAHRYVETGRKRGNVVISV